MSIMFNELPDNMAPHLNLIIKFNELPDNMAPHLNLMTYLIRKSNTIK